MQKSILSILSGLCFVGMANAADMTIYYSPTCPHCHHVQEYTKNNFIYEYPTMKVTTVDVTVPENRSLFIEVLKSCDFSSGGVPVIKIGEKCFQGFGESMADDLRAAIETDLSDDAKKSAESIRKNIAADGAKYRNEHPKNIENVSEYSAPVANAEPEQNDVETPAGASNNKLASWILAILALVVVGLSVSMAHKKK